MATIIDHDRIDPVLIIAVYLVGLLLFHYHLLTITVGETMILRPDWLLSLPLITYALWNRIHITKTSIHFGIFTLAVAVSGIYTGAILHLDYWTATVQLIFAITLLTAMLSIDFDADQMRSVFRFWIILVTIAGVFGIYQSVGFNTGLPSLAEFTTSTTQSYNGYNRPNAFYTEPSMFASVLMSGIAVLLPAASTSEEIYFSKWTERLLLVLLSLALLLAASLGGYLVAIASVVIFLLIPGVRRPAFYALTGLTFIGAAAFVASAFLSIDFINMIVTRFRAVFLVILGHPPAGGGSVDIRLARALTAIRTWAQNPVFGTGLGLYNDWIQATDPSTMFDLRHDLQSTHGAWVQVLAVTGTAGALTFVAGWLQMFRDAGRVLLETKIQERVIVLSGICLVVTQLVAWVFDMSFVSGLRWGLVGLAYAGIMSARERP